MLILFMAIARDLDVYTETGDIGKTYILFIFILSACLLFLLATMLLYTYYTSIDREFWVCNLKSPYKRTQPKLRFVKFAVVENLVMIEEEHNMRGLNHKQKQDNYNNSKERHLPPCLNCEYKYASLIPGPCLHNIYCVECGMVYLKEKLIQKMPSPQK
jgi:hypothetical protein